MTRPRRSGAGRTVVAVAAAALALTACGTDLSAGSPKGAAENYADHLENDPRPDYGADCHLPPDDGELLITGGFPDPRSKRTITVRTAGRNRWTADVRYRQRDGSASGVTLDVRRFGDRYEVCGS